MRIYIFCFKKTHRQTKKFPVANLFVRIYVFSLQTIKDRALCFSTKKSTVRVVFRHSHSRKQEYYFFGSTFLNIGTTIETLQQSGKQDSLRKILQNSASMYEGSRWQFFRATTAIQSGPHALSDAEDNSSGPLNRGGIADLHYWQFAKSPKSHVSGKR